MKNGRQRRIEILARRRKRSDGAKAAEAERLEPKELPEGAVPCDSAALELGGSYGGMTYERRGYYLDEPYVCRDCGVESVWTAASQRWWYEVAKGYVWSRAVRCRNCLRRERERREDARRVSAEGLERKRQRRLLWP